MSEINSHPVTKLLEDWLRRARESQHAHYEAAKYFGRLNYILGVPVIVLSTLIGTTVFSTLEQTVIPAVKIILGLISVTAGILASLQTFLGFAQRAERHRSAGSHYGSIRREIEQYLAVSNKPNLESAQVLSALREKIDAASSDMPEVPQKIWARLRINSNFEQLNTEAGR